MRNPNRLPRWMIKRFPLLLVLLFAVLLQLFYHAFHQLPMHWDPSHHTEQSMRVAHQLIDSPFRGLWRTAVREYRYYPPGFHLSTAPAFLLLGFHFSAALAWQIGYLVITLCLIALLVERETSLRWGAFAAFVYLACPYVLGLSRMSYIENLLALQVVLFAFLCLQDKRLERLSYACAVGFVAGWGQLTKWPFFMYILPLALILLVLRVRELRRDPAVSRLAWSRLIAWLGISLAVAAFVAGPWYLLHLKQIRADVAYQSYVHVFDNAPPYALSSILWYWQVLPWQIYGLPLSLLIYVAWVTSLVRPCKYRQGFLFGLAFLGTVALLSLATHKQARFLAPILPFYVIVLVQWLARRQGWWRKGLVLGVCGFSCVNLITFTLPVPGLDHSIGVPMGYHRTGFIVGRSLPDFYFPVISREQWHLDALFQAIQEATQDDKAERSIAWKLMDEHPFYNGVTLHSYAYLYDVKVVAIEQAAFCVCRFSAPADFSKWEKAHAQRRWTQARQWTLPDGTLARLYQAGQ